MSVRTFTAEELLKVTRDRGGLNDAETEGTTDSDLIDRINEECLETLYNMVLQAHREHYVITTLTTISASSIRYRIPPRAMYQKVRDIYYRSGTKRRALPCISRERLEDFSITGGSNEPAGFYIEGNSIVLVPDVGSSFSGQLEISYYFRPGQLVLSTACRQVLTVNLPAKQVTVASIPTGWVNGTVVDVHSSASGAEIHTWDNPITIASLTLTFTNAIDGSVQGTLPVEVGDWICLAETAALPGLPREMHTLLAQAVNVLLMEGDDPEGFAVSKEQLEKKIIRMMKVIGERMDSRADVIVPRNSLLWAGHGAWNY